MIRILLVSNTIKALRPNLNMFLEKFIFHFAKETDIVLINNKNKKVNFIVNL